MINIEELKKKFIVDKKEYEKEKLPCLIEKTLLFCKVDEDGIVNIENPHLKNSDKIKIVLVARFLANKLNSKIQSSVKTEELLSSTGISDRNILYARISELTKQKICFKEDNSYEIYPYQANIVLDKIHLKYGGPKNGKR